MTYPDWKVQGGRKSYIKDFTTNKYDFLAQFYKPISLTRPFGKPSVRHKQEMIVHKVYLSTQ